MGDTVVGDTDIPRLEITPAAGDTVATLTLRGPDGSATSVVVSPDLGSGGGPGVSEAQVWTGQPVTYTLPGQWILDWSVTGTGQNVEQQIVYVLPSPAAGAAVWWPGRSRVAGYIPARTLTTPSESIGESSDSYELTFGPTTRPTGQMVDRLIADQAAFVSARIPQLAAAHHEAAGTIVAMLVAALVERGIDSTDGSTLQRATDLERRALSMLEGLVAANDEATGESAAGPVMPVFSFPPAVHWGDQLI